MIEKGSNVFLQQLHSGHSPLHFFVSNSVHFVLLTARLRYCVDEVRMGLEMFLLYMSLFSTAAF